MLSWSFKIVMRGSQHCRVHPFGGQSRAATSVRRLMAALAMAKYFAFLQ